MTHPVTTDECFWQHNGSFWVQHGECDDGCTCLGPPSAPGALGIVEIGICDCSAPQSAVWQGEYRTLSRDGAGIVRRVISRRGERIPTETLRTTLSFAAALSYVAIADAVGRQTPVLAVIQRGAKPDAGTAPVAITVGGETWQVSQTDNTELDRVVREIRRLFNNRDDAKVAGERVFFRLTN